MKVSELIDLLMKQDPDADVLVMSQPSWPFEMDLAGVTTREEMLRAERDEDGDGNHHEAPRLQRGTSNNDVFLVEGKQLRYGSKTAWDVATR
jgi:hypothetical protein